MPLGVIYSCKLAGMRESGEAVMLRMSWRSTETSSPLARRNVRLVADSVVRIPAKLSPDRVETM